MIDSAIQEFVACRRIAVVGASRSGKKFGNAAAKELRERGYEIAVIHPNAREIDGQCCYPNLSALPNQVDAVLISVPAAQAASVMREAAGLGIHHVWLQQGAESPDLLALGEDLGLSLVSRKCILMYAPPVKSFHGWHRGFVKLVGKL